MSNVENQLFDGAFPIKIGKQEFQTSMLTDRDYADLDLYIKARFIELIRKTANELDDEARKEILSVAIQDSMKIGWGTSEGADLILRDDGMLHLGYQMIRKRHGAQITFSKFEALARGKKDGNGQWVDLKNSIEQIFIAWEHFNPKKENKDKEDVGGSSTGSEKSDEQDGEPSE